jgi:hypothetical protein
MPFDWTAFLNVAHFLEVQAANFDNPEALQRTAVGRAYYGAFNYALEWAEKYQGYQRKYPKQDDHGALRNHFKNHKRQNAAECLDTLRQWRNDADYDGDLNWPNKTQTVSEAIAEANRVLQILPPPKPK